ncbi:hypothetical protein AB0D04_02185, partial [Streptomyces sp. NPDC048483]|uniref:hypothetical protein n=1 Tax=Streptomyces sp. NPDC048483 TaxID=3154927 RepID=UPI0034241FEB
QREAIPAGVVAGDGDKKEQREAIPAGVVAGDGDKKEQREAIPAGVVAGDGRAVTGRPSGSGASAGRRSRR